MSSQTISPVDFRTGQREQWNVAASGWRKWSAQIDAGAGEIRERLVELAGVGRGDRVLDIAAGYGEPALTAAQRVGPEGHVVATDIAAEMLAYGRERAAAAGLENLEFIESDAASLDFPAASFDCALSSWGIIFEPDGEAAAARVRTFLKPGARMAISSWGLPERVPFLAVPMRTAMQRLQVPPPPPGTPGPLSRPTPEALGGLLEKAGFSDVQVEELEVVWEWESPEDYTTYLKEIAPPIMALINPRPPDEQEATWAAIRDAIRAAAGGGSGPVRLSNQALLAAGRA
jgi:SAM-dependent methyltransferase